MTGTGSNTYGDGQGKTIVHDHEQTDTASLSNVCIKYGGQANGEDRDDISATHHGDFSINVIFCFFIFRSCLI